MSVNLADPHLFWEAKVLTLQSLLYIPTCTGVDTCYNGRDNRWFDLQYGQGELGNKIMAN